MENLIQLNLFCLKLSLLLYRGKRANDHNHLREVLKTIIAQSLKPKEVVIIDSGDVNNFTELNEFLI